MDTIQPPIISPLTMRESARGITLSSVYDEMLARRELSVVGDINSSMAHDLCQQIRLLAATDPAAPHHDLYRQPRRQRTSRPCHLRHHAPLALPHPHRLPGARRLHGSNHLYGR